MYLVVGTMNKSVMTSSGLRGVGQGGKLGCGWSITSYNTATPKLKAQARVLGT